MDFSAHFAQPSLPERLRQLATLAEDAGVLASDVYGSAPKLQAFEGEVAELLGKQEGAFFITGTLAQRAALHAHLTLFGSPDSRVFLHPTSHLVHHDCLRDGEAQAKRARTEAEQRLPSFTCELVGQFSQAMCAKDCVGLIRQGDVVVVELPQRCNGGRTMAWEDLQQLSSEARRVGARLHMDGARLWEVQPYYDRPLHDICALFDSVYVSFYKGLGGMSGAMLCSDAATMAGSRDFRTRLGGSVMALAPIWLDAREQFQSCMQEGFSMRFKKLQEVVRALSADSAIRSIMCFEPAEPQACLIHVYLSGTQTKLDAAHAQVKQATGRTLWNSLRGCGYQVPARAASADGATEQTYFEWNMGPANSKIPTADFVEAWQAFARALAEEP